MMKKTTALLLLLCLTLAGCQGLLLTPLILVKGRDNPPKYDILQKGKKRVAIVPRAVQYNTFELQNAPREIARHVNSLIDENVRNKKLQVVEQSKVEAWIDDGNNNFDSFLELGKDPSINADIVIGFDIHGFQIRDPQNAYLVQGKCQVFVEAVEVATGKVLAKESLTIVDPPSGQQPGGPNVEPHFRRQFVEVVARRIAALFHHYDPHRIQRIDADNLEMHRF